MKQVTVLMLVAALLLALTAGVAVAELKVGTNGPDALRGTPKADTLKGVGGNDKIYGRGGPDEVFGQDGRDRVYGTGGNDKVTGGFGNDLILRGGSGDDTVVGNAGADRMVGDRGDDIMRAVGDTKVDAVNCGEDADGQDIDTAYVQGQDLVDSQQASLITTTTALSCEVLFVDGIRIPTVAAP